MKFPRLPIMLLVLLALALAGIARGGELDPQAYVEKAAALIEQGEYALARAYLDPAVIAPRLTSAERSRAYWLRGHAFQAQALFVSALADYTHALEFNPLNPEALYALGGLYVNELGGERDPAVLIPIFRKAAELGHLHGQLFLGVAYLTGEGTTANLAEARHWLGKAAEAGSVPAMTRLASSFRRSHTDAPEPAQARHWYEKALEAGSVDALVGLGFMYRNGELGDVPASVSVEYFQRAADQGSGVGMVNLAHAYLTGNGVAADYTLARSWYRRAAQLGVRGSFAGLGHIHEAGLGVPPNVDEARSWYEKGSEAGHPDALVRLLHLLVDSGRQTEAARWAQRALEQGNVRALNLYAWLLATSPAAEVRDGEEALRYALEAVQLEPKAAYLDTLAAAYAELSRFEDALAVQQQALDAAGDNAALVDELTEHLAQYRQARPWRE